MYRICHYLCVYLYHYHASIYLLFTTYLLFSGALTFKYKYSKHCKVTASSTNILCWSNCLSPTCAISDVTPANVPEKVVEVGQSDWYLPPKWIPRIGLSVLRECVPLSVYTCASISLCHSAFKSKYLTKVNLQNEPLNPLNQILTARIIIF